MLARRLRLIQTATEQLDNVSLVPQQLLRSPSLLTKGESWEKTVFLRVGERHLRDVHPSHSRLVATGYRGYGPL